MAAHLLHVYGVKDSANRDELRKIFRRCGNVVGVDKLGKGSALVGYMKKEEADQAMVTLQFTSFDGRVLKITKSILHTPEHLLTVREPNYGYCLRIFFCFSYNIYECLNAASGGQCLRGKHFCFHCFMNGMGHLAHSNKDPNCPSRKGGWEELQHYKSAEDHLKPRGNPPQPPQQPPPQPPQQPPQQPPPVTQQPPLDSQMQQSPQYSQQRQVDHSQRPQLGRSLTPPLGHSQSRNEALDERGDRKRKLNQENLRNLITKRRKEVSSTDTVGVATKVIKPSTSAGFTLPAYIYNKLSAEEKQLKNIFCGPSKPRPGNESSGEDGQPSMAWSFPARFMSDGPKESKQLFVDKDIANRIGESIPDIERRSKTNIKFISSALWAKRMKVFIRGTPKDIETAWKLLEVAAKNVS